jgi:hypothetical protein
VDNVVCVEVLYSADHLTEVRARHVLSQPRVLLEQAEEITVGRVKVVSYIEGREVWDKSVCVGVWARGCGSENDSESESTDPLCPKNHHGNLIGSGGVHVRV